MKNNKTTDLFKEEIIIRTILPSLNWKGVKMVYNYTWNGEQRYAVIPLMKLIDIIKFDVKKLD